MEKTMKKKYRLKKSAITVLVIFIFLIALIVSLSLFRTKSYSIEYNIFDYDISENYDKDIQTYYFEITKDSITYPFVYESEYQKERKIIKDIKEYKEDNYTCLKVEGSLVKTYPLCSYQNEIIDYHLVPETIKEKISEYIKVPSSIEKKEGHYEIYNTEDEILVWSYKGFTYIKDGKTKKINIFKEDIYEIPLATKINNYIFIPDYEQKYNFNKAYVINLETHEVEEWKLKYEISFDSYIIGTNDRSIYLIDKKNKKEYELVPSKQKMRIIAKGSQKGTIYDQGTIKKESMSKLVTKDYSFTYKDTYNFISIDNLLYLNYLDSTLNIKLSNQEITTIVHTSKDNVYYLINDTLYRYNLKHGETKIMKYSEWNINYKNLIFINN
jgi:hypothetical protein